MIAVILLVLTSGCTTPHTSGGAATQAIQPETGEIQQALQQSDNPASESKQTYKEVKETLDPDNGKVVERITREADTTIGAAQDLAGILKQANANKDFIGRMLLTLGLFGGAWFAWRQQWPLVACVMLLGGLAAVKFGSVAAVLTLVASALVYVAYTVGLKTLNPAT